MICDQCNFEAPATTTTCPSCGAFFGDDAARTLPPGSRRPPVDVSDALASADTAVTRVPGSLADAAVTGVRGSSPAVGAGGPLEDDDSGVTSAPGLSPSGAADGPLTVGQVFGAR
jgi:hypothetical protein